MMEIEIKKGKDKDEKPDDWEIDNWVSTLMGAEEIKGDEKKMMLVNERLKKKRKAIDSIAKLREVAKEKTYSKEDYAD